MSRAPYFVGVREKDTYAVFSIDSGFCLSLHDAVAHVQPVNEVPFRWGELSAGSAMVAFALLLATTGDQVQARQMSIAYMEDVVQWLERDGWELTVESVRNYVELWNASPARCRKLTGIAMHYKWN